MSEFIQFACVEVYRDENDRSNCYTRIADAVRMNIRINKPSGPLGYRMAHCEHVGSNPTELRNKLVCMRIITMEFQCMDENPRQDDNKDRGKKRAFEDRIQLKAGTEDEEVSSRNEQDIVPQQQITRRKKESRCYKCIRKYHRTSQWECGQLSQTPPLKYTSNPNQVPVNTKARRDKERLRVRESI